MSPDVAKGLRKVVVSFAVAPGGWWLALMMGLTAAGLPAQPTREYDLKAVFLFNFTQFADWPEAALGAPDRPFVIGILGDDPFGSVLDAIVRDEQAGGRPLTVRRYRAPEEVGDCQVLFIGRAHLRRHGRELATWHARHILTVADGDPNTTTGCAVELLTAAGKIRLRVDVAAAQDAGVSISSKLLRLAERVGEVP